MAARKPILFYVSADSRERAEEITRSLRPLLHLQEEVDSITNAEIVIIDGDCNNLHRRLRAAQIENVHEIIVISRILFSERVHKLRTYIISGRNRKQVMRGKAPNRRTFRLRRVTYVEADPLYPGDAVFNTIARPLISSFGRGRVGARMSDMWYQAGVGWTDRTGTPPIPHGDMDDAA